MTTCRGLLSFVNNPVVNNPFQNGPFLDHSDRETPERKKKPRQQSSEDTVLDRRRLSTSGNNRGRSAVVWCLMDTKAIKPAMIREEAEKILRWHAQWSKDWGGPASDPQFMDALRTFLGVDLAPVVVRETARSLSEAAAMLAAIEVLGPDPHPDAVRAAVLALAAQSPAPAS